MILFISFSKFLHRKFTVLLSFLVLILSVQNKSFVRCMRSQALAFSSRSSADAGEGPGSSPQSQSSSSINRERELISAQFRAAQDPRDLDNGGEVPPGMESLQASGLMEDEAQIMPTYMAAASHSASPSKLRLNRYSQTGYYNPYPSYVAAFPNVPSTYYGYNSYPSYREKQIFDPIYETMQTRAIQAQSQAVPSSYNTPLSSVSNSNRDGSFYGDGPPPPGYRGGNNDNEAAAGGHGGGHGWGHGGWGWTSKVNTNGIGLLGLLGLLSLLSNVLLQFTTTTTTTTTAAGRRRKRDVGQDEIEEEDHEKKRERIFMEILPHLTPVAFAPDGSLPLECTFHGVCMANKILVKELGVHGRVAGARISSAVVKLLDKDSSGEGSKRKSKLKKRLESAALHGRDKKDCEKKFPICSALKQQAAPNLPFVIRMQDLPQLISKISMLSQGSWGGGGGVPVSL